MGKSATLSRKRAKRATGRERDSLAEEARRLVRAEMQRRGFTHRRLAAALDTPAGPVEEVQALTNKINRGRFSFAFALRLLRAMGVTRLDIAPLSGSMGVPGPEPDAANSGARRSA